MRAFPPAVMVILAVGLMGAAKSNGALFIYNDAGTPIGVSIDGRAETPIGTGGERTVMVAVGGHRFKATGRGVNQTLSVSLTSANAHLSGPDSPLIWCLSASQGGVTLLSQQACFKRIHP